jgi:hypothetical protein
MGTIRQKNYCIGVITIRIKKYIITIVCQKPYKILNVKYLFDSDNYPLLLDCEKNYWLYVCIYICAVLIKEVAT